MSFQSYVIEKLTAISEALNLINTKAKDIDSLPVQSTLDPSSKIHVSRNGESESLQIQKIIDAVQIGGYNRLLSIGVIDLNVNIVTIPAFAQWVIDNINYSNPSVITIPIPYCASGLSRKDILVANKSNQIVLVKGPETAGITIQPNLPPNTVYVTEMDVTDSSVGQPQPPEVNGSYVEKSEQYPIVINGGGGGNISVDNENGYYEISSYGSPIASLTDQQGYIYLGKEITFRNTGTSDLTFTHNATTSENNKKFFTFPNEQDLILSPKEVIKFKFGSNGRLNYVGKKIISSWNELQDKPTSYPPSAHTHNYSEITGKPTSFPPSSHSHSIADVAGLQGELDSRIIDSQIEIGSNTSITNLWNGKTILFTSNCTITVPSTLLAQFGFVFRTLTGVTVTWAITEPFTWETTPTTTPEKTTGNFMRRGSTNTILLDF